MALKDLLFPKKCAGCGSWGDYLCANCLNQLQPIHEPICPMCAKKSIAGLTHAGCKRKTGMDGLIACVKHRGITRKLISKFKYKYISHLAGDLTEIIISLGPLENLPQKNWYTVAVPLHPKRYKWRGFNQAEILAQNLSPNLGWHYQPQVIKRIKHTPSQMHLKRQDRLKNMQGAFDKGSNINQIHQKHVILIDDVWTTGATMRESTKILKRAGAKSVWGLVIAR